MTRISTLVGLAVVAMASNVSAQPKPPATPTFRCASGDLADYPLVISIRCPADLKLGGTFPLDADALAVFEPAFRARIVDGARRASNHTRACYGRERTTLEAFRRCRERVDVEQAKQRAFVAEVVRRWPVLEI